MREPEPSLKILTLSSVFPNPDEPGFGLFVRARAEWVARLAQVKVMAPVAVIDYARRKGGWIGRRDIPKRRSDGSLEVLHPRWIYPPFGGALNGLCLFLALWPPVARLRRVFAFGLIDAHFGHPDGIAAALLSAVLGVPFVVTLRGSEVVHSRRLLRRLLLRWALRRAGRVVCVAETLRRFAIEMGADPTRTKTIPNGIDARIFYPRDRLECRRKHGIPRDIPVVLTAGNLIELKGHHHVVQAVKRLSEDGFRTQLLIAGGGGRGGPYERDLRRLAAQLGVEPAVRFLGQVPQEVLAELMSAADVLCLASSREGWPNVVQEAMGCGTPVVATDVGAVPDMIPSDLYGLVAPANQPAALEAALATALTRKWDRTAIAEWASARSWAQVAQEVAEQMHLVLAEKRAY